MTDFASKVEQLRIFVEQQLPSEGIPNAVPVAVLFLIGGIGLSVLGAKLARFGFTGSFIALGAVAGFHFAPIVDFPAPVCSLLGAAMIGAIGHLTFRLWVGAAFAVVFCSVALGMFGYQKLLPHFREFEQTQMVVAAPVGGGEFVVPTSTQQQQYTSPDPKVVAERFWAFVTGRDAEIERRAHAIGTVALITGLFLGVVAVRWALILSTALLGTTLVTSGAAALITTFYPEAYRAFLGRPDVGGMVVGAFFVTSFILQAMLTRKAPADDSSKSAKS